jgi:hypothetical protein
MNITEPSDLVTYALLVLDVSNPSICFRLYSLSSDMPSLTANKFTRLSTAEVAPFSSLI